MARPRKKDKERWTSVLGIGYVEFERKADGREIAITVLKGDRKSTGIEKRPENKDLVVNNFLLPREQEWIDQRLGRSPVVAPSVPTGPSTWAHALKLYLERQGTSLTESAESMLFKAERRFFPEESSADLTPFDVDQLTAQLVRVISGWTLALSTQRKYLEALRLVFATFVQAGNLRVNPVDLIGVPREQHRKIGRFQHAEVTKILEYCDKNDPRLGSIVRFMALTGMRISEATQIKLADVTEEAIYVAHGKGGRPRWFPLKYEGRSFFPELMTLIDELQQDRALRREDYLLPHMAKTVQRKLLEARKALAMPLDDRRSTHSLRKFAEYIWEFELKLPAPLIDDLGGHQYAIRKKFYRDDPSLSDVAGLMHHHLHPSNGQGHPQSDGQTLPQNLSKTPGSSRDVRGHGLRRRARKRLKQGRF